MPYPGVPKSKTRKMERCVAKVKRKGSGVNPYAVCHNAVVGKKKSKS